MSVPPVKKNRTYNDKLLIGVIIGAMTGFLIYWSLDVVTVYAETLFISLIALIIIIALLLLLLTYFRNRIIRKFFGKDVDFGSIVSDSQHALTVLTDKVTDTLLLENEKRDQVKKFAPKIIGYLIWSNFRNWGLRILTSFILGLGGVITTLLILNQNKLFENQNNLLELQNIRIQQQTHLLEAERRSAQVFIMGDVLSDLNKELNDTLNKKRVLSSTLSGRIISLSRAMTPYRFMQGDSLMESMASPERGQLLYSLIQSKIDSVFLISNVFVQCDFSYAILNNELFFIGINFSRTNLEHADFSKSFILNSDFSDASLSEVNLHSTLLRDVTMKNTELFSANMKEVRILGGDWTDAILMEANLNSSSLIRVKLDSANLYGADLTYGILRGSSFKGSTLTATKLIEAEMNKTDLRGADLERSDFSNIKTLDSAKVDRYDWLSYIKDSLKLKGANDIYSDYRIDSIYYPDEGKKIPTLIRKK